ncbi:MAG: riboflavin synthase, partial [Dehalococcoidia bacterium]
AIEREGDGLVIRFAADETIMRYVVPKGFVAVDGISLTVVDRDDESFSVAIIPYTLENTTLKDRAAGSRVNVEVDITAKYVEQMAKPYLEKLLEEAREAAGP